MRREQKILTDCDLALENAQLLTRTHCPQWTETMICNNNTTDAARKILTGGRIKMLVLYVVRRLLVSYALLRIGHTAQNQC